MRHWMVVGFAAFGVLSAAQAECAELRRPLAAALAETVVTPALTSLRTAFSAQANSWAKGCANPVTLRTAYHAAADAWASIEFLRSGPMLKEHRAERIAYWPDPRNATERGLAALRTGEAAALAPERIASASVAVQGLPLIERILFSSDNGLNAALSERDCAIGKAVAQNLANIGNAVHAEWTAPVSGTLARTQADASSKDAETERSVAALTELATFLQIIDDRKLPPLFGGKGKAAAPRMAESWRSQRSVKNLVANITAAISAFSVIKAYAPDASAAAVERLMAARAALTATAESNQGIAVLAALNNARYYAVDVLPGELGVSLGFNSLDGD